MRILRPNKIVERYDDISLDFLKKEGIEVLVCDIDNTLVGYDEPLPNAEVNQYVKLLQENGIEVLLVSNNKKERCEIFAKPLHLEVLSFAKKPFKKTYLKILKKYPNKKIACIGDQILTDIVGGNRFKFYTIKTKPIKEKDSFVTLFSRTLEKLLEPIWRK